MATLIALGLGDLHAGGTMPLPTSDGRTGPAIVALQPVCDAGATLSITDASTQTDCVDGGGGGAAVAQMIVDAQSDPRVDDAARRRLCDDLIATAMNAPLRASFASSNSPEAVARRLCASGGASAASSGGGLSPVGQSSGSRLDSATFAGRNGGPVGAAPVARSAGSGGGFGGGVGGGTPIPTAATLDAPSGGDALDGRSVPAPVAGLGLPVLILGALLCRRLRARRSIARA